MFLSETIQTTQAKAQAVKGLIDRLINQAKNPDSRRLVSQFLNNKKVSDKLINDLAPRLGSRYSGYTSIIKVGTRLGDGASLVRMKLLVEEKQVKESKPAKESNESVSTTEKEPVESSVKSQKAEKELKVTRGKKK